MRLIDILARIAGPRGLSFLPMRLRHWPKDLIWRIRVKIAEARARWQEPRLFNAAHERPAWQSSTRGRESRYSAGRATAGKRGFSSTRREDRPWWVVDLRADWPIYSIRIHGRRGRTDRMVARLQVSISPDQRQWEVIHSGHRLLDDAVSPGPLTIRLLETRGARFVKLELLESGTLALNQVEVMVARRHKALLRVCLRYGFAFERMTSLRMRRHVKPYSVQNVPWKFDGRLEALYVNATQGRFGNHVHHIGGAVCLARHLGIPRVYLKKLPMLEIDRPIKFGAVTVLPESDLQRDRPKGVLCGTFFYRRPLGRAFRGLSYRDIAEAARAVGQPIFHCPAPASAFRPEVTDLVVHFRAGDIFARSDPHANYAQPPLAFYRLCVEFARTHLSTQRIVLVYEDEGNPCVAGLKSWLDQIGVPYVLHARTLEEDMAVLFAAAHCVFGRGSFGLAIAILSKDLRTLFYSWLEPNFGPMTEVAGFRPVKVEDVAHGYIRRGDWRNTVEQKQMMLDYPIENLQLRAD